MLTLTWNAAARKSTRTCLSCSLNPPPPQMFKAPPIRSLSTRTHQRRHSSSKPSSPPKDSSTSISNPSAAAAAKATARHEIPKRRNTSISRRKAKEVALPLPGEVRDGALWNLPSVPSTQYLTHNDVFVASFFSIHRPISVTASIPPTSSSSAFSSIFTSRNIQKPKPADVIYTLSTAVNTLENAASQSQGQVRTWSPPTQQPTPEEVDLAAIVTQSSVSNAEPNIRHLDGTPQQINLQDLAKKFRPFIPPPPPVPMTKPKEPTQVRPRAPARTRTKRKSYSTLLTITESTYPNGHKTYKAHTSPIREETTHPSPETTLIEEPNSQAQPPRTPFIDRMRSKQERWEDFRRRGGKPIWRAISVKRQRKLKMKKHKYKKLMKKTRNLRRKLDKS